MRKGVFIGRATMDILFYQQGIPSENQKGKTEDYAICVGGNACNAAVTYTLLGGKAVLVTAIGDSVIGRSIREELTGQYGIEVIDLLKNPDILPFLSAIWINRDNETRTLWGGHQPPAELKKINVEELTEKAAFFLADDQFPGVILPLFCLAKEKRIPTVFDAERWREDLKEIFAVSSDVIASADCQAPGGGDLMELLRDSKVSARAVTDGKNPVRWETGETAGMIVPMQVEAVDTLGAGDILHGAYCYFRFCEGQPFEKALENACEVSSVSVAYQGPRAGITEYMEARRKRDR